MAMDRHSTTLQWLRDNTPESLQVLFAASRPISLVPCYSLEVRNAILALQALDTKAQQHRERMEDEEKEILRLKDTIRLKSSTAAILVIKKMVEDRRMALKAEIDFMSSMAADWVKKLARYR